MIALSVAAVEGSACRAEGGRAGAGQSAMTDSSATAGATMLPDSGTLGQHRSPAAPAASGSGRSSGGDADTSGTPAPKTREEQKAPAKRAPMRPPAPHDTSSRPVPRPKLPPE